MKGDSRERISALLHGISVFPIFLMAACIGLPIPLPIKIAALLGIFLLGLGASIMVWAALHLKKGLLGEVKPETEVLVTEGPYTFVRHPIYLGMIIAFLGFFVWTRNIAGIIGVFALFLPSSAYRAKLEEEASIPGIWRRVEELRRDNGVLSAPPKEKKRLN